MNQDRRGTWKMAKAYKSYAIRESEFGLTHVYKYTHMNMHIYTVA